MFVGPVRTSTLILGAAFLVAGFITKQSRYRALIALALWLGGWETVWQLTGIAWSVAHSGQPGHALAVLFGPRLPLLLHQAIFYGPGVVAALVAWHLRLAVDWRFALVAVALYAVWLATGFHVNLHEGGPFDPLAEALNEGSKTAWGLALLIPLIRPLPDPPQRGGRSGKEVTPTDRLFGSGTSLTTSSGSVERVPRGRAEL